MTHTKGEWRCLENSVLKDGSYAIKTGDTLIGFASDNDTETSEETKANAKLIAAAPDLLEALQLSESQLLEAGFNHQSNTILTIQKAISKATT